MTAALTPDDLARIEELAEKATPGPWTALEARKEFISRGSTMDVQWVDGPDVDAHPSDAEFIAAARNDVPLLVAGVRSRDERITELEGERAQIRSILALSGTDVNSTNKILDVLDGAR